MPKTYRKRSSRSHKRHIKRTSWAARSPYATTRFYRQPKKSTAITLKQEVVYTAVCSLFPVGGVYTMVVQDSTGTNVPGTLITFPTNTAQDWPAVTGGLNAANAQQTPFSMEFLLDQVPTAGAYLDLFDEYRIAGVKVQWEALFQGGAYGAIAGSNLMAGQTPEVYMVADFNDATVPDQFDELNSREGVKHTTLIPGRPATCSIRPRVATSLYNASTLSPIGYGYSNQQMWVDGSNPRVPHYGIKGWLRNLPVSENSGYVPYTYRLRVSYIVQFRRHK